MDEKLSALLAEISSKVSEAQSLCGSEEKEYDEADESKSSSEEDGLDESKRKARLIISLNGKKK